MVVVPLPWLRRQLGIHCRMNCETRSPQCHLPTQLEDVPVSTILGTLSALEVLCDYALYKSTFTLHYVSSCPSRGTGVCLDVCPVPTLARLSVQSIPV